MPGDFAEGGRRIRSPTQPPVAPQHERQGAGNQPEIVEMRMQEGIVGVGFDQPAVDRIRPASHLKKPVPPEAERFHNNARMISPAPRANTIFNTNTLILTMDQPETIKSMARPLIPSSKLKQTGY